MKNFSLAQRIQNIQISPTLALSEKAAALKAKGLDIISFGAGEPDFDTPKNIQDAAIHAIQNGETRYTPVAGTLALKKAIQHRLKSDKNLDYTLDEISTACGGKHSLYNIFQVLIDSGDEVVIPAPYWVSYPDQVILAHGTPVIVHTKEENNFCLTAEEFQGAITTKTKILVITSPNNPTGSAYTKQQIAALTKICLEKNIFIVSDEIYEKIVYDNFTTTSPAQISPDAKNITCIVNGVSKAYAMTGWRMGFAAGPEWLIAAINKLQGQSTSNISSITQAACVEAFNGPQDEIQTMVQAFSKRRNFLVHALNQMEGVQCQKPQGAFYVFPNIKKLFGRKTPTGKILQGCVDVCDYLLEEAQVAIVPGLGFGMEGYMRLSYATRESLIQQGVQRIEKALSNLR